jgi:hypothetical protein
MLKGSIYIALIILLAGCSSDNTVSPVSGDTVPLKLSATQAGLAAEQAVPLLSAGISTGIYVTAKDANIAASCFGNQKYISQASGNLSTDANVNLTLGSSYDIYAYAPYQGGNIDPKAVEVSHGTDVLWAPKYTLSNVAADHYSAALSFDHRVAQVSFKVIFADDYDGSRNFINTSLIAVTGFYGKGFLDITTGVLTPSGTADTSLSASGTSAGSVSLVIAGTCFIPASGMKLKVSVKHDGVVYNGVIEDSFVSGNQYRYTVTLKQVSAMEIKGLVTDWKYESGSINVW